MDYIDVEPSPFQKEVAVPGSKSYANRFLILAALREGEVAVGGVPHSTDVETLISCLEHMGLVIKRKGGCLSVANSFPECERPGGDVLLKTGDGGTTNRFLAALSALGSRRYVLAPEGRMKTRPMDELLRALGSLGVETGYNQGCVTVRGPVRRRGEVRVDCRRSSQFASALLLALSKTDIRIAADGLGGSRPYWRLSRYALGLKDRPLLEIPPDFSCMAYPLALAATDGAASIANYAGRDPYQGDSAIVDILKDMGAAVDEGGAGLRVERAPLKPLDYDCADCPDLVPVLAYLCSRAGGTSRLGNTASLRYKESDRVEETTKLLGLFGVEHRQRGGGIEIRGPAKNIGRRIDVVPAADHRMVMTAYLFLRTGAGGRLCNHRHAAKSFPGFFEAMAT